MVFVIGGLVNLWYVFSNKHGFSAFPKFKWWMMTGLVFACLGDLFLIDFFEIGVIFFALGHVFYFISFCMIQKFSIKDLLPCGILAIFCAVIILFYPNFDFDGMQLLILIYALIISCMVGKSTSNYLKTKSTKDLIVMIGSIMFFLSDFFLLFRLFAGWGRVGSILCLTFYYPAQFILALSIYTISKNTSKGEN